MKKISKKQYTNKIVLPNISYSVEPCIPLTTHFLLNYIKYSVYYAQILCNAVIMRGNTLGLHNVYYRNIVKGESSNNAGGWRCAVGQWLEVGRAPEEKPPQGVEYIVTTSPTKYISKTIF